MWLLDAPDGRRVVVKLGCGAAIDREARGLAHVAGLGVAPAVVAHGPGTLVTEWLAGDSPGLATIAPERAAALGRALARIHGRVKATAGSYDGWETPARDLPEYRRRRARDISSQTGGPDPDGRPAPAGGGPFCLVHGDVWGGNVIWQEGRPRLVDWEFHRVGDPAEDLAYAAAMDDMPPGLVAAVLTGYGAPHLAPAVRWWRPLLALDCAEWFTAEGDAARAGALRAQAARLLDAEEPPGR